MAAKSRNVSVADRMWARLMSSTNQPNFTQYSNAIQQKRKQNASEESKVTENGPDNVIETGNRQGLPCDDPTSLLTISTAGDPTV